MKLPTPLTSRGRSCQYHHPGDWDTIFVVSFLLFYTYFYSLFIYLILTFGSLFADVVEWPTRLTQNQVFERTCGFKSRHRHHNSGAVGLQELTVLFLLYMCYTLLVVLHRDSVVLYGSRYTPQIVACYILITS